MLLTNSFLQVFFRWGNLRVYKHRRCNGKSKAAVSLTFRDTLTDERSLFITIAVAKFLWPVYVHAVFLMANERRRSTPWMTSFQIKASNAMQLWFWDFETEFFMCFKLPSMWEPTRQLVHHLKWTLHKPPFPLSLSTPFPPPTSAPLPPGWKAFVTICVMSLHI